MRTELSVKIMFSVFPLVEIKACRNSNHDSRISSLWTERANETNTSCPQKVTRQPTASNETNTFLYCQKNAKKNVAPVSKLTVSGSPSATCNGLGLLLSDSEQNLNGCFFKSSTSHVCLKKLYPVVIFIWFLPEFWLMFTTLAFHLLVPKSVLNVLILFSGFFIIFFHNEFQDADWTYSRRICSVPVPYDKNIWHRVLWHRLVVLFQRHKHLLRYWKITELVLKVITLIVFPSVQSVLNASVGWCVCP